MTELSLPPIFGSSVFCDDIRPELGNKHSFMGVYNGSIILPQFPFTLPKFCIFVYYFEKVDAVVPPLTLQVYLPGDQPENPRISVEVPSQPELPLPPNFNILDDPRKVINVPIQIAPFVFDCEGPIKVRMKRGDDIIRLGSLLAMQGALAMPSQPFPTPQDISAGDGSR